jgi:thioredoxin reductase (NADPH)
MAKVLIIGAGPAGVSAALYTARAGTQTTVVYCGSGALAKAEIIQNYYGLAEPMQGADLAQAGIEGAKKVGVSFIEDEIVWIGMDDSFTRFVAEGSAGKKYEADSLILAAGARRSVPKILGITEYEGRGVSYCAICDAFFYRGKNVGILGAGEYALHELEMLRPHAAKIKLFTDGAELAVNVPAEIQVCTQKTAAVEGNKHVTGIRLEDGTVCPVEGIFVAYGSAGSVDLARKIGAAIDGSRILVGADMATNVPGLFAAGDCTGGLMQIAKAVYEGAAAGLSAVKYLHNRK